MSKRYLCPNCDEPEFLSIIRLKEATTIRCLECGWHRDFMPKPSEDELHARIEQAVREARGVGAQ